MTVQLPTCLGFSYSGCHFIKEISFLSFCNLLQDYYKVVNIYRNLDAIELQFSETKCNEIPQKIFVINLFIRSKPVNKLILIFLSTLLFVFSTSQAAELIQENEKGEFSAQLNNVKLSELTTFIQEKYGIEFKGQDAAIQTSITLSFKKLNLEQMLKKILAENNFVFTYNKAGKVTAVTLLQAGNKKPVAANNQTTVKDKVPQMPAVAPQGGAGTPEQISNFQEEPNSQPDEITSFKIEPNAPPPGDEQGNMKMNEPDPITSFKIIPNAPPPGN